MKKMIAKTLSLVMVLSFAIVYSPTTLKVDVVSAATNSTSTPTTTTTPAKPVTAPVTATVTDGSKIYVVVSGDKMWKIAQKHNITLEQLKALNPQIKNFNLIYIGQKIIVGKVVATPVTPVTPVTAVAKKLFHGFGEVANYRFKGTGNLNLTTASVIFDQDGKIVDLTWDVMEITNTLFPGWLDTTTDAATQGTFKASITNNFKTKIEEGLDYGMKKSAISGKEWFEQLDFYESFFKGKTVAQVEAWVEKYTDPVSKRPYKMAYLNSDKLKDADKEAIKAATANFTAEEKAMLVDVTSGATMSLQDDHSYFISALKEAFNAKQEVK